MLVMESVPYRVERAKRMGAECVLLPEDADALKKIRGLTNGQGVDCALDCSGSIGAERFCIEAVRRRGRGAFIGGRL